MDIIMSNTNHQDGNNAVNTLVNGITEAAGDLIERLHSEGAHVTKGDLAKQLAKETGNPVPFVTHLVTAYVGGRSDLEQRPGRDGGIYPKGGTKAADAETTGIYEAAKAFLSTFDFESKNILRTSDLAAHVSESTGVTQVKALRAVTKYLKSRSDLRLVQGPFGGIKKALVPAAAADMNATEEAAPEVTDTDEAAEG